MQGGSVGVHLSAALAVARELRSASSRKLRVRFITDPDGDPGLLVCATIGARTNAELEAQDGRGRRFIPLDELDARAGEIPDMVRSAVSEVQAAVAAAPAPPPRPSAALDDAAVFEEVVDRAYEGFVRLSGEMTGGAELPRAAAVEAVVVGAMRFAALAGLAGGLDRSDLHDMVKNAISELSGRSELAKATYRLDS
ncbi:MULTISPECIES: hypothetical protein [unclassified Phenylobacterium]|uniref:hypothetical protein n=1 Tax=unclassified Phenylobacterium TaxID=2640670 RepID=UPI00083B99B4|nr:MULTISPECIES: hypothetical protein [unclassified Phenylobacterium]